MFNSIYLWLLFVCFILIINNLYRFYSNVNKYPTGPLPIPVFGNVFMLIRKIKKTHPMLAIHSICQPYGDLCTFWFGSTPVVIIQDLVIGKIALNRVECSGRPVTADVLQTFTTKGYSKEVQFLRKLSVETIRQLQSSNKFNEVVVDVVTETVDALKSSDQQLSTDTRLSRIPIRIIAELMFGWRYSANDNELKSIQLSLEAFNSEMLKRILTDFFPLIKYFVTNNANSESQLKELKSLIVRTLENCRDSYRPGMCDNSVNCLLAARIKLIEEKRDNSKYTTDSNLASVLSTVFIGATDTTITTFRWIYLILCYYPDVQQKLRDEINDKIGKSYPKVEDRKKFDYFNAFICETLRFRVITPFAVFHKTTEQTNISNIAIPKDTMLAINIYGISNDPKHWNDPKNFIPERFLDSNSSFIANRFPAFIPFSTGKRMCVGESIAVDMIFVILVCLLQSTHGYQLVLANGTQSFNLDYGSNPTLVLNPNPFKMRLKKIEIN